MRFISTSVTLIFCRNGEYPIKGIDTTIVQINPGHQAPVEMESTRLRELTHFSHGDDRVLNFRRNGEYPIKGIDTLRIASINSIAKFVEMESTRLRELTHSVILHLEMVGAHLRESISPNNCMPKIQRRQLSFLEIVHDHIDIRI